MDVGKPSNAELQRSLLAAGLVPVVALVHPAGHPVVPPAMKGDAQAVGHFDRLAFGREDPPRPIAFEVDEEQVVRVEPAALELRL